MPNAGGWQWTDPLSQALAECLIDAYEPDEAKWLAREVAGGLATVVDFHGNAYQVWHRLLDAAARAGVEDDLVGKVLANRMKAGCHEAARAWRGRPARLQLVPDLPVEQPTWSAHAPPGLAAAVDRLRDEADELGLEPTAGLVSLHLPALRAELRQVEAALTRWEESVLEAHLAFGARSDLLLLIAELRDAVLAASAAISGLTVDAAPAAQRLQGAVDVLADRLG